ncbi:MAG: HEXXH motif-containing putative peptide modification protein, partial [Nitrospirota bacterium]
MLPQMKLFDSAFLSSLVQEFRASMRGLVFDLCDDLRAHYQRPAAALRLPVDYFRFVGESLKLEDYSSWKVVGWIEELNDLLYFIDLREQLRRERDRRGFAEAFLAECQEQFYEHGYLDDLFPLREPEPGRFGQRLSALCARLAWQATQESLGLVPGLPCEWLGQEKRRRWAVPFDLGPNFERAEQPVCIAPGLEGAYLEPPLAFQKIAGRRAVRATLEIACEEMAVRAGGKTFALYSTDRYPQWGWREVPPQWIRPTSALWPDGLTLGPALIYGKDKTPSRVAPAPSGVADRIDRALAVIEAAWPEGAQLLGCLTARIVPLKAKGVVSFSYRHRPGLSFINTFERDQLDLIDDLVHENSHHHLNLLLRKYVLYRRDRNREIFYSPWRRSLRPLRGILHATFTFTMGAILFERLSSWAATGKAALTDQQI